MTGPQRDITRWLFLGALTFLLLAGLTASGSAREEMNPLTLAARGARPTTETLPQMLAREARRHRRPATRAVPVPASPTAGGDRRTSGAQGVSAGFNGLSLEEQKSLSGSFATLPDPSTAVGPNHFMQIVNGSVAIYSRAGSPISHIPTDTFFQTVSEGVTYPRNGISQHRVLYDPRSRRWFACGVEGGAVVPSAFNNHANNQIILVVSRTSDPTGTFDKYVIPMGVPSTETLDYVTFDATLSVDDNGVYVGASIARRDRAQGNAITQQSARLAATTKIPLIATPPSLGGVYTTLPGFFPEFQGAPQIAQNLDPVTEANPAYVVATSPGTLSDIAYRTINWNAQIPYLFTSGKVDTPLYGALPNVPTKEANGLALLPGDDDLQGSIIRNGRLWTCRTVGVSATGTAGSSRTGCEWLELQTSTAGSLSLVQSGRVYDPGADPRFYYLPSLAVSGQGHVALGFSGSRGAEYISAYACGRLASDPAGTMSAVALLKAGEAGYALSADGSTFPWGRYSQTSVDPNNDQTLWTAQAYARAPVTEGGNWGTWINSLAAPAPVLDSAAGAFGYNGQTGVTFTLTGSQFFDPGAGFPNRPEVTVSGAGVSNISVTVQSPTMATVTLDLAPGAPPGTRDLTFTNPDGQSATLPNAFVVNQVSLVALSAASYTVSEGSGSIQLQLQRTGNTSGASSVQLSLGGGTATPNTDYEPLNQTVTFDAGVTSQSVTLVVLEDNLLEEAETVAVTLSNPQSAVLGTPATATVTIADDGEQTAPTHLTANILTLSQVRLNWTDHSNNETGFQVEQRVAGSGSFTAVGGTGANVTTLDVGSLTPGGAYEFRVTAVRNEIQSAYSAPAAVEIATLQFSAATYSGGETGGTVAVTITRTGGAGDTPSVTLATADGSAVSPGDYTAQTTTITFGAQETSRTVNIAVHQDADLEGPESFQVTLSNVMGAGTLLGTPSTATVTILDGTVLPPPTSLTALPVGPTTMRLAWTDNSAHETGFVVERSTGSGSFAPVATAAANTTLVMETTATGGTAYTYRVRAVQGAVQSEPSNEAQATIPLDGKAKITPAKLNFATVKLGKTKSKKVVIQNLSKTGALAGFVSLSGPGYTVVSGGGAFSLAPKKKLSVVISFAPPAAGAAAGTATVLTTATNKPSTSVPLKGVGK